MKSSQRKHYGRLGATQHSVVNNLLSHFDKKKKSAATFLTKIKFLIILLSAWVGNQKKASHMDSNSSMRCLVLPCRIRRRVLYLSRPALTFSAWIRSLGVFLLSSTALASSALRNCGKKKKEGTKQRKKGFYFCLRLGETIQKLLSCIFSSLSENTLLSIAVRTHFVFWVR